MKFIKRIRLWLQKPWFVGLLSVVAILFSAKNIVLPLIDISSKKSVSSRSASSRSVPVATSANSASNLIVAAAAPADAESSGGPLNIRQMRTIQLSGIDYRRNPFLFANDSRQPGFDPLIQTEVQQVYVGSQEVAKVIEPSSLFELNAILDRNGSKVAMINRQVAGRGDLVQPEPSRVDDGELSVQQQQQLQQLLAMNYELTSIDADGVVITAEQGSFRVSFRY